MFSFAKIDWRNVDTLGSYMTLHAKIQKWGNGLALRIGGAMREIPRLKEGTEVDIEVTETGFTVAKQSLLFKPNL